MTATDVANGVLVSNAATVTFTARYAAVEVKNEDATNALYVTSNGTTPGQTGGDDQYEVSPGERVLVPNQGPMWWQGYSASPGTTIKIASVSATAKYEVVGIG